LSSISFINLIVIAARIKSIYGVFCGGGDAKHVRVDLGINGGCLYEVYLDDRDKFL
jgi:hypothetical protein